MSAGQGWKENTNNTYSATFSVPKTQQAINSTPTGTAGAIAPNQKIRVIVNNETGAIQLYEVREPAGDRLFNTFNPSTGRWVSPQNDAEALTRMQDTIGIQGLQKLQTDARNGAVNSVINPTSTQENKDKIFKTEGYKSLSNTASGSNGEDGNGDDTAPAAPTLEQVNVNTINKGIKTASNVPQHGNMQYPLKMTNEMDKIKFTMYDYGIRELKEQFLGFSSERPKGERKGAATLGIQPRISDSNSVNWNDLEMSAPELAAAGASLDFATQGFDAFGNIIDKIKGTIGAEESNIREYGKLWFAQEAAGVKGLTSRIGGVVLNPNLELLFQGPQLRPFNFNFQLSPRDKDEAAIVKRIIRFFKQGMAVQRSATELFLKAPHIFTIEYLFGNNENHPGLNKIKDCALISCDVDYTPSGSYMTYEDGTMISYNISLAFRELTPIYADDYKVNANENVSDISVGY